MVGPTTSPAKQNVALVHRKTSNKYAAASAATAQPEFQARTKQRQYFNAQPESTANRAEQVYDFIGSAWTMAAKLRSCLSARHQHSGHLAMVRMQGARQQTADHCVDPLAREKGWPVHSGADHLLAACFLSSSGLILMPAKKVGQKGMITKCTCESPFPKPIARSSTVMGRWTHPARASRS